MVHHPKGVIWIKMYVVGIVNTPIRSRLVVSLTKRSACTLTRVISKRVFGGFIITIGCREVVINMDGCIGIPHWLACYTCRNNNDNYGCVIKEKIPLHLDDTGEYIICGDYERD